MLPVSEFWRRSRYRSAWNPVASEAAHVAGMPPVSWLKLSCLRAARVALSGLLRRARVEPGHRCWRAHRTQRAAGRRQVHGGRSSKVLGRPGRTRRDS